MIYEGNSPSLQREPFSVGKVTTLFGSDMFTLDGQIASN